jgi:hypothetical protein
MTDTLLTMADDDARVLARPFEAGDAGAWDELVRCAHNGTFMHTRHYLGYHGDRFTDASLVFTDVKGAVLGLLPAAVDPGMTNRVTSHPGLTYGGVVHAGGLRGEKTLHALEAACRHYRQLGLTTFRYKTIPTIYHRNPVADDVYALFRLNADRYRCDLAATVDLGADAPVRRNRRRNLEAAQRAGLTVTGGLEWLAPFWDILTNNLMKKFNVHPAHSLVEMQDLATRFPDEISCDAVLLDGQIVAGLVNYHTERTLHCQYSAASAQGFQLNALDLGFSHAIDEARARGNRYFDFGVCNEQDGRVLNSNLYDFKISFGAGSTPHEFFDLAL